MAGLYFAAFLVNRTTFDLQNPPTVHVTKVGADCIGVNHILDTGKSNVQIRAALSNSFAFGGSNAVLAFRAVSA